MAKPELGIKRTCASCGAKYYDLNRDPIVCPSCGAVFALATPARPERPAEPKPEPAKEQEPVEVQREEGVVSLEEAEADGGEDTGPDVDGDSDDEAAIADVEGAEIEDDVADDDSDDTFLEEEEDGDDVSGLLDVESEDEDER